MMDISSDAGIVRDLIREFMEIQDYMLSAKKENAMETYAMLKKRYVILKSALCTFGVNLESLDMIKE